jgi:hypothetical protein
MVMTKVRIGARAAKRPEEVIEWLSDNIGPLKNKETASITGTVYFGKNWSAHWKQYGAGWFMDVSFHEPKHAMFFSLRWK